MGASRVMEAVAKDILFGPFLAFVAQGTVGDNPVAAVLVTWVFVEFFLLMGALNTIAQVLIRIKVHITDLDKLNLVKFWRETIFATVPGASKMKLTSKVVKSDSKVITLLS